MAGIRGCINWINGDWFLRAKLRVRRSDTVSVGREEEGTVFSVSPQIPLDGMDGQIKFEPRIHVVVPKLHVEYTTTNQNHQEEDRWSFRNSDGFLEIGCQEQIFHFLL